MMLFYRNLFVYSRVFFAVHLNARSTGPCSDCWPSHPVNLIQSLSFKSTRPRVNCNVEWRRLARALFSPASNFKAQFPNLNPPELSLSLQVHFCLLIWCPDLFDNYWKKWPRAFKTRCDLAAGTLGTNMGIALGLWSVGHSQVELNFYPYFSHIFFNHIFPMRWHSRFSSGPGPAWSINHWGDNAKYVSRKDDSFTNDHFNELLYRVPANHSSISVHYFPSRPACFICLKSLKSIRYLALLG